MGNSSDIQDVVVPLSQLPSATLQSLYHAVTGKTENISKALRKNVIINYSDVEQLYERIQQQLEHYTLLAEPTVTVIVKQAKDRSIQYSSWQRFKHLQINTPEVTSEVFFKLEFLLQLPNTHAPQRCIVSISMDSGLPWMIAQSESSFHSSRFIYGFFSGADYLTVKVSIDFADFFIAKTFVSIVEEWFGQLADHLSVSRM